MSRSGARSVPFTLHVTAASQLAVPHGSVTSAPRRSYCTWGASVGAGRAQDRIHRSHSCLATQVMETEVHGREGQGWLVQKFSVVVQVCECLCFGMHACTETLCGCEGRKESERGGHRERSCEHSAPLLSLNLLLGLPELYDPNFLPSTSPMLEQVPCLLPLSPSLCHGLCLWVCLPR